MAKHLSSEERSNMTEEQLKAYKISRRQSKLMKDAHKVAKIIVNSVGDYSIALGLALKFVNNYNKNIKALRAEKKIGNTFYPRLEVAAYEEFKPDSIVGIPAWAIEKDFSKSGAKDVLFFTVEVEVIEETEKAFRVSFETKNPKENFSDHSKAWIAKSILINDDLEKINNSKN